MAGAALRSKPNILIVGTPGVGKSTLAIKISQETGIHHLEINEIAKQNDCYESFDESRQCHVLDEEKLLDSIEDQMNSSEGGFMVDYHGSDFFPERWFDLVIVLRDDSQITLKARGYQEKKITENVECEIFGTLEEEARDSYKEDIVKVLRSDTVEDMETNADSVVDQDRSEQIRKEVFANYTRQVKPGSPVTISVGLIPLYIEDIDEHDGQFTILIGIDLYWRDPRLSWRTEADHPLRDCILVEFQEIWTPEVRFTLSTMDVSDLKDRSPIRVCSDGHVHIVDYRRVTRVAKFYTEEFPFDYQNITIALAQVQASTNEVVMLLHQTVSYEEIKNHTIIPPQWSMINVYCINRTDPSMNEFEPKNYSGVMCRMRIKRDPSFVVNNFCIPSFIVTILAVVAVHSAQSADGGRTNKYELGLVSLMSVSVLTLSLTDYLPQSGTLSRLHILYYLMMTAIATSCFISWIAVVFEREWRRVPRRHKAEQLLKIIDLVSVIFHIIFLTILMIWFFRA